MKKVEKLIATLAAVALIIGLLISAVELAAYGNFDYFRREYEKYDVLENVDMEMEDLMHVTREMMAYLRGDREVLSVETTVGGKTMDFFNEQDRIHMKDVQYLFLGAEKLRYLCTALIVAAVVFLAARRAQIKTLLPKAFLWITGVFASVILVIGVCAAIDFNACFTIFHQIFFRNDLWLFDPNTDLMINVLVEEFFMDMALRIVLIFVGMMAAVSAVCVLFLARSRRAAKKAPGNASAGKIAALLLAVMIGVQGLCPLTAGATLTSPVEDLKTAHVEHEFFFPEGWPEAPELVAESAVLIELNTGTVLYAKNADVELYPASMTKVMTGLLVAEYGNMNDIVTYSWDAVNLEKDAVSMGLLRGEMLTVQESMYGMMLLSANDAANGLAEYISGSMEDFATLMNLRAQQLGAYNTHFSNPSGLFAEDHYTTCYDMALILAAAVQNPAYLSICTTYHYTIEETENYKRTCYAHLSHSMKPNSAYEYEGFVCGKTGWVPESGNTLATYCERDGMKLVAVVMKDSKPNHYLDTIALMDYGFENFKLTQIDGSLLGGGEDTGYLGGSAGLFEQAGFSIEENMDSTVLLPKDAELSDIRCTLDYDPEITGENSNVIATIAYSYNGLTIGTGTLEFVRTGESLENPKDMEDETATGGNGESEPATGENGGKEIILTVTQVMTFIAIVLVVVLLVVGLALYLNPAKVRARRIRKRRRDRIKRRGNYYDDFNL